MLDKAAMTIYDAVDYILNEFSLGDKVYDVRESSGDDTEWYKNNPGTSSWDHPSVVELSDVCEFLKSWLAENK